jgi:superfamily II DNA or RNA helicase
MWTLFFARGLLCCLLGLGARSEGFFLAQVFSFQNSFYICLPVYEARANLPHNACFRVCFFSVLFPMNRMETLGFQSDEIPGITLAPHFRFRKGQAEFLQRLARGFAEGERNFLGVFVPGYGKTITALASFLVARSLSVAQKLVVFVPRGNLRDQYADPRELASLMRSLGAPPLTFCVADSEKQFLRHLSTDVVITTYQYASGRGGSEALRQFCARSLCMFVFDEVHHLSHDGTWATKIKEFPFSSSVALSGTPMRSDNKSLFGVPQEIREDEAGKQTQFYKPLHETLLRDAHAEGGVLKKVRAHVMDYAVTLRNTETGSELRLSLSELADCAQTPAEIDAFLTRKRLRFHEAYLQALLQPAFERFAEKRRQFAESAGAQEGGEAGKESARAAQNHQMLIIAMSNAHAAAILDFVRERFPEFISERIGQDIPARDRARSLKRYREGAIDVMTQVDMIGEGTDIKPISVIVKADLVRALSKTMQQLFRGMRYYAPFKAEGNICDVYASNDAEIVDILEWLVSEEQIGVSLGVERGGRAEAKNGQFAPQSANKGSWELAGVEHEQTDSHGLELRDGALEHIALETKRGRGRPRSRPETMFVFDDARVRVEQAVTQAARERELRRECSELMMKLAHVLPKDEMGAHSSSFMLLHSASMQRFSKPKDQMNAEELARKREWLKQCLKEKKVV